MIKFFIPRAWTQHGDWISQHRVGLGQGLPGTVAGRREGLIVNDYRNWPAASPLVLERSRITPAVAEPLAALLEAIDNDQFYATVDNAQELARQINEENHRLHTERRDLAREESAEMCSGHLTRLVEKGLESR